MMTINEKRRMTFPLRLAISLKAMAKLLASEHGISLNHFISLAVAEKVSRLESETLNEHHILGRHSLPAATEAVHKTVYT